MSMLHIDILSIHSRMDRLIWHYVKKEYIWSEVDNMCRERSPNLEGVPIEDRCIICGTFETTCHVFFTCTTTKAVEKIQIVEPAPPVAQTGVQRDCFESIYKLSAVGLMARKKSGSAQWEALKLNTDAAFAKSKWDRSSDQGGGVVIAAHVSQLEGVLAPAVAEATTMMAGLQFAKPHDLRRWLNVMLSTWSTMCSLIFL
ncbi:Uncharacterized protein Adt_10054 [Abeliophyllum distichum]|uniref:Reverse transcriptase zinc-binding domain-containing protein n=1 Tax=Abeliophyllum distichum TaxID=126358 RepID=A0ABD1UIW8_9LAMI